MEVEVWVQVLESLSECLPTQLRDCSVPIMGECGELDSPNRLSKTAAQQQPAWHQLGHTVCLSKKNPD